MRRPSHQKLSSAKRREAVEKALRSRGWSEAIVEQLIAETGASRATIYRDRHDIAAILATEETAGLEERRALFLMDLRRTREDAKLDGAHSATARMLDMESKILGLDRVPLPEVAAEADEALDTSLEGVLREVRKLRRQAQAGHSYVAADKLLAREHELVESIRARDDAARAAELAHLNEEGLIDLIISNVANLPDTLRARLREALDA
jgi:hypothetical protein